MTATSILVQVIEHLVVKIGDDDGILTALKAELAADEVAESALEARVLALEEAALPSAPDLTQLTDRVTALEDRNASDDTAAGGFNAGVGALVDPATIALGGLSPTSATVGQTYGAIIATVGGVAPLSFSILSGALPDGLSLSAGGAVTGTPTTAGDFEVAIQAHDANGTVGQAVYHLIVAEAPPVAQDAPVQEPAPDAPAEAEATA